MKLVTGTSEKYTNPYATKHNSLDYDFLIDDQYKDDLKTLVLTGISSIGIPFNDNSLAILEYKNSITDIVCGKNIKKIEYNGFSNCSNLSSVKFSSELSIGKMAFDKCIGLSGINGYYIKSIDDGGFYNCSNLSAINFPNALFIGTNAFNNCSSLISAYIPNVNIVNDFSFANCTSLSAIDFTSVNKIGNNGLINCKSLSRASLNNATSIGDYAFAYCDELSSVDLNANLISFSEGIFKNCSKLKRIKFGANLSKEQWASPELSSLENFPIPSLNDFALENINESWTITVPPYMYWNFLDNPQWRQYGNAKWRPIAPGQYMDLFEGQHIVTTYAGFYNKYDIKKDPAKTYIITDGDNDIYINFVEPSDTSKPISIGVGKIIDSSNLIE